MTWESDMIQRRFMSKTVEALEQIIKSIDREALALEEISKSLKRIDFNIEHRDFITVIDRD